MEEGSIIREYVDDYNKYFPEKWRWSLKDTTEQLELYRRTRARRCKNWWKNNDLLPDFYSIERDAARFGLAHVEWTDIFGLIWKGEKGVIENVGAPNYQGNLYYYDADDSYDDLHYAVSDIYDAYDQQPPEDIYTRVKWKGFNHWIDTLHVNDVEYKYIVTNHLFKDTHVELIYEDGEQILVFDDYQALIDGILRQKREDLVNKILKSMNEHFCKLRDSERKEVRDFYPGKTAEEMFLGGRK